MNKQWQAALQVIEKIEQAGFEAVFVGGAVRDQLLNRPCHDVDVATSALPEEVKRIFYKTVDIGIEHGTILVMDEGEPIEVTTYRTEGDYIDFRRPEEVRFVRQLEEDLKRRDFTMNALAMRSSGEIVDLYGGMKDIKARLIRAVGVADERFTEDALRMLRAIRFSAQLNFDIEAITFQAIKKNASLMKEIAVERIAQELEKIWCSELPIRGIQQLIDSRLAQYLYGDFEGTSHKWTDFKAIDNRDGWAYFVIASNDMSVIKQYKLSNNEKNYIMAVKQALELIQQDIDNVTLFHLEESHIETAGRFATWLFAQHVDVEVLISRKRAFPITDLSELHVSGRELMAWRGQRGGPWVKRALDDILQAVLDGQLENEVNHIKEWFLRQ